MSTDPRADRIELNQDINIAWQITLAQSEKNSTETLCAWFEQNLAQVRAVNAKARR